MAHGVVDKSLSLTCEVIMAVYKESVEAVRLVAGRLLLLLVCFEIR